MSYRHFIPRRRNPNKFYFAWSCPAPPSLSEWVLNDEDREDYEDGDIIDYINDKAFDVEYEEFSEAVGGRESIVSAMGGEPWEDYDPSEDWNVNFYESEYPDGTKIYFFTQSRIEHVFEPDGYS
jgi:hypothetical protein